MSPPGGARLRVAQVSVYRDPWRRMPNELLRAWRTLGDCAEAAFGAGLDVTVVQAAWADQTLERNGVSYHFVPPAGLLSRLRSLQPDLVHFQGLGFPLWLRRLRRALPRVPVLVQDHAGTAPSGWRRWLHRRGLASAAGVAFAAREQAEPFLRAGVVPPDVPRFEVLEGTSRFTPGDQTAARRATGFHGDPCLLWVGRLDANKDPLTVLRAVAGAAERLPDARLWCCFTEAPLRREVEAAVGAAPALAGRVTLLGALAHEELEDRYRAADFVLLGSHREGCNYAVIEGYACGSTPLVTDIPAFRMLTGNGAHGALSRPGDAAAMAAALVEWARRDRGALRAAARAHFERSLSLGAMGRQLLAAYQALAERP